MTATPRPARAAGVALGLALLGAGVGAGAVDPPSDAVLVDGLALLAGGRASDESSATAVLVSDVRLEADLLLARRFGPEWRQLAHSQQLSIEARRVAALVALLARQARQMGEEVDPVARAAAQKQLAERAGGPGALAALIAEHGATAERLQRWLDDTLLAAAQVRFLAERVEPPGEREVAEQLNPARDGADGSVRAARERLRRELRDRQVARAVANWLEGTLDRSLLRLLR